MKIHVANNLPQALRESSRDIHRMPKNPDPLLHPFEKAREYKRALNAVKLDRLFAKPFVASLEGHRDGVYCMAKNRQSLDEIVSGSADGECRIWDIGQQRRQGSHCTWRVQSAHEGFVRGVCFNPYDRQIITCGTDRTIKIWDPSTSGSDTQSGLAEPIQVFHGRSFFSGVDHHRSKPILASSGTQIDIWDQQRTTPITSYTWGADTINTVKFNQTEVSVLASCGTDRTVILYDIRASSPLSKLVMNMKGNAISWNPMEAFNFAVANEDHNVYLFDMRRMNQALNVLKDHVAAVTDVDFSPTGQELVTASYDKSIRIFPIQSGRSRDIYHTGRMQRVFAALYSMDSKFVISGSDDGCVRVWKAHANEKLGSLSLREKTKKDYNDALLKRYGHMPEIHRIARQRHVPKPIKKASELKREIINAEKRKDQNRRLHSKPGLVPYKPERKKPVVAIEE